MKTGLVRVGVREFRQDLAQYLESATPIAVTRYGQTVGYYIPALGHMDEQEMLSLKHAVEQVEALLADHGITEDEVASELRVRRLQSQSNRAGH